MGRIQHRKKFWEQHIARWDASDLNQEEYCHQNGISLRNFKYWRSKTKNIATAPALVELTLPQSFSAPLMPVHPQFSVVLNEHYRIELGRGFDSEELERLIHILVRI